MNTTGTKFSQWLITVCQMQTIRLVFLQATLKAKCEVVWAIDYHADSTDVMCRFYFFGHLEQKLE